MSEKIKALKATGLALTLVEKIFNVNFEIKGEENIPKDKSIMFVANHFTRFETVVVPHILNKIKGLALYYQFTVLKNCTGLAIFFALSRVFFNDRIAL